MTSETIDITSLTSDILEDGSTLNINWIAARKWAAVPIEKWSDVPGYHGIHLLDREAEWISKAAIASGYSECFALPVGFDASMRQSYRVSMTEEDLLRFSWTCAGAAYLLIPADQGFAILCTTDGYNIVSGGRRFVVGSIGASIAAVREDFYDAAKFESGEAGQKMMAVAERYRSCDGRACDPVNNAALIEDLRELRQGIVETPVNLNLSWLRRNNLAAVPMDRATYSSRSAHEWIERAAQRMNCSYFWAIPTESDVAGYYGVAMDIRGLGEFQSEGSGIGYLLVNPGGSCAILYTPEDYVLVAGAPAFVADAIGAGIATTRRYFLERFAKDDTWGGEYSEFLVSVARRYEQFNG